MNIGTVLQDTLQQENSFEGGTFMNELMSQVVNSTTKFKKPVDKKTTENVMFTIQTDQDEEEGQEVMDIAEEEEENKENLESRMPHQDPKNFIAHKNRE